MQTRTRNLLVASCLLGVGCATPQKAEKSPRAAAVRLAPEAWPQLVDSLPRASLIASIERSIVALASKAGDGKPFPLGDRSFTRGHFVDSLRTFLARLDAIPEGTPFNAYLTEEFDLYKVMGPAKRQGRTKFTSYYDPTLDASPKKTVEYPYPLYARPKDLVEIKLAEFDSAKTGRLVGRMQGGKLVPYFTRAQIDDGALDGRGLEIAWMKSRFDVMDIHIQGSGRLVYPDGTHHRASFAATNNHKFKGWITLLKQAGALKPGETTPEKAKAYLRENPEIVDWVLQRNARYTFFKMEAIDPKAGPRGSLGAPLTTKRSIAVDPKLYPLGTLGFVEVAMPVPVPGTDAVRGTAPTTLFVSLQDTGGAITGPGRADFFAGHGLEAKGIATRLLAEGHLYILIKKLN